MQYELELHAGERLTLEELADELEGWKRYGKGTTVDEYGGIPVFANEFWTSKQRAAHSLHEISYRACFKPQLPRFFITRLTDPGDLVFDPFMGRGTTPLEAAFLGRETLGAVEGSRRTIEAGAVLVSLGLEVEAPALWGLDLGPRGRILTDLDSCMTNREGVFAAGDAVTGPGSIVDAMDQGKRAAVAIDRYLGGDGDISEVFAPAPGSEMVMRADIAAQGKPVTPMPTAEAPRRTATFEIVERGYAKDEAVAEARRCIRCDLWRTGAPNVWSKQQG